MSDRLEPTRETFLKDVANHEMQINLDNELLRHIVFRRPSTTSMLFSLTTTPGRLIYAGDMGCFVFQRLPDMFAFFRRRSEADLPNFGYRQCRSLAS